jgi:alanyl-tRNA synthetase
VEAKILALVSAGASIFKAAPGEQVEVILPKTCFYVESGGQVSDKGVIVAANDAWKIQVTEMRKPAAGVIVHVGEVVHGAPRVGDWAFAKVDAQRRSDIMRHHTATHLLHAELRAVLGDHARQAGSLVAPDRLRFDFTHPEAVSAEQLERIEAGVNHRILENHKLNITFKPLQQAIGEGAMALFGEKYADTVRAITIGGRKAFSYELCGGTHVDETGDIGICLVTSESSVASGIRRIEAVCGRGAYELIQRRMRSLKQAAAILAASQEDVPQKVLAIQEELSATRKQADTLRWEIALSEFKRQLELTPIVKDVPVMAAIIPGADADALRQLTDHFRQRYPSGVAVLASVNENRPTLIASVSEDLVKRGLNAGELVKHVAAPLGGGGGGRATLAQAGGKDASRLAEALASVNDWLAKKF